MQDEQKNRSRKSIFCQQKKNDHFRTPHPPFQHPKYFRLSNVFLKSKSFSHTTFETIDYVAFWFVCRLVILRRVTSPRAWLKRGVAGRVGSGRTRKQKKISHLTPGMKVLFLVTDNFKCVCHSFRSRLTKRNKTGRNMTNHIQRDKQNKTYFLGKHSYFFGRK